MPAACNAASPIDKLDGDAFDFVERQRATRLDVLGEIIAVEHLHRQEDATGVLADIVQAADVIARDLACDGDLAAQALDRFRRSRGELAAQHLEARRCRERAEIFRRGISSPIAPAATKRVICSGRRRSCHRRTRASRGRAGRRQRHVPDPLHPSPSTIRLALHHEQVALQIGRRLGIGAHGLYKLAAGDSAAFRTSSVFHGK